MVGALPIERFAGGDLGEDSFSEGLRIGNVFEVQNGFTDVNRDVAIVKQEGKEVLPGDLDCLDFIQQCGSFPFKAEGLPVNLGDAVILNPEFIVGAVYPKGQRDGGAGENRSPDDRAKFRRQERFRSGRAIYSESQARDPDQQDAEAASKKFHPVGVCFEEDRSVRSDFVRLLRSQAGGRGGIRRFFRYGSVFVFVRSRIFREIDMDSERLFLPDRFLDRPGVSRFRSPARRACAFAEVEAAAPEPKQIERKSDIGDSADGADRGGQRMLLDDQAENQRQSVNRRSDQEKRQDTPVGIAFVHEEYSIITSLPDDESGRFFDCSACTQMINDVESGKIGIVIMKDRIYSKEYRVKNLEKFREYEEVKAREYRERKKLQVTI